MSINTICNDDCICVNCDCIYSHPISFQDRKIIRKLYNSFSFSKKEDNPETRRKNCFKGKLCLNFACGFRHRLVFNDRLKLNESFENFKLQVIKEVKNKPIKEVNSFSISTNNLFQLLNDDSSDESSDKSFIESSDEFSNEFSDDFITNPINIPQFKTGFKDALIKGKVIYDIPIKKESSISWADMCDNDDDFFMKF